MKVLITGASGFVGKKLFWKVKEKGFRVTGIYGGSSPSEKDFLRIDLTYKKSLRRLFSRNRFDLVFHLAAHIPKDLSKFEVEEFYSCFNVNFIGTVNLLEAVAESESGTARFVYASSASVYGRGVFEVPIGEDNLCPQNYYAESKLLGEVYLQRFSQKAGFSYAILRYSSVYGSGMKENSVLPIFLSRAQKSGTLKVQGSGRRSQDFVYVDDVVEAALKAGLAKKSGIYNIGSGFETTMLELAKTVISVVGHGKINFNQNKDEVVDETEFFLDIGRSRRELKYSPKFTLVEGLAKMHHGR